MGGAVTDAGKPDENTDRRLKLPLGTLLGEPLRRSDVKPLGGKPQGARPRRLCREQHYSGTHKGGFSRKDSSVNGVGSIGKARSFW